MTLFEQFSSVSFVSTLKLSIRTSSMKVGTISSSNKSSNLSTAYKEYIYIYIYNVYVQKRLNVDKSTWYGIKYDFPN